MDKASEVAAARNYANALTELARASTGLAAAVSNYANYVQGYGNLGDTEAYHKASDRVASWENDFAATLAWAEKAAAEFSEG